MDTFKAVPARELAPGSVIHHMGQLNQVASVHRSDRFTVVVIQEHGRERWPLIYEHGETVMVERGTIAAARPVDVVHMPGTRPFTLRLVALLGVALVVLLMVALLSSCATTIPVSASGPINGTLRGTSPSVQVLGITVVDRGSVQGAAQAAGIRYVQTVHVRETNLAGIYHKRLTIVTGE